MKSCMLLVGHVIRDACGGVSIFRIIWSAAVRELNFYLRLQIQLVIEKLLPQNTVSSQNLENLTRKFSVVNPTMRKNLKNWIRNQNLRTSYALVQEFLFKNFFKC